MKVKSSRKMVVMRYITYISSLAILFILSQELVLSRRLKALKVADELGTAEDIIRYQVEQGNDRWIKGFLRSAVPRHVSDFVDDIHDVEVGRTRRGRTTWAGRGEGSSGARRVNHTQGYIPRPTGAQNFPSRAVSRASSTGSMMSIAGLDEDDE